MKITRWTYFLASVVVSACNAIYSYLKILKLPDTVPVHWNLEGKADRFGSKWELLAIPTVVSMSILVIFALIFLFGKIAPGSKAEKGLGLTLVSMAIFFWVLQTFLLKMDPNGLLQSIGGMLGWLTVMFGYTTHGVEPNPYIGVRTSWTLNNPAVWRTTHERAAKLWLFTGGFMLMTSPFTPFWFGISLFLIVMIYPVWDSWKISRTLVG